MTKTKMYVRAVGVVDELIAEGEPFTSPDVLADCKQICPKDTPTLASIWRHMAHRCRLGHVARRGTVGGYAVYRGVR